MNESLRRALESPIEAENVRNAFFVWVVTSALILLIGPFTDYSPAGFIDPWVYTGYFTNFSALVRQFGLLYYPSRLPYVLFGVLIYSVFSPISANFLINLCLLSASALGLYCIIAKYEGRFVAAVTAFLFSCNPYVISTISWDYPDGPAITLLILGLWIAIAPPARLKGRFGAAVIGSLWAMAGFTNLIAGLIILPGLLLIGYMRQFRMRSLIRDLGFIALGVTITTVFFGLLSKRIFGTYLFCEPQFKMFHYVNTTPGYLENMWGTGLHWLTTAYRLGFTYGLGLAGVIVFVRYFRRLRLDRFYTGALLFLAFSNIVFFVVEFLMKDVVLRVFYTSSYLVVPAFVFLGAVLGSLRALSDSESSLIFELELASALIIGLLSVYLFSPFHSPPILHARSNWLLLAGLGLTGVLAACLLGKGRNIAGSLACICLALLVSIPSAVDPGVSYVFTDQRPAFEAAMDAQNILTAGAIKEHTLRFWFDNDERWSPLFNSINSLYLWGWRDYTQQMPSMPADDVRALFGTNTFVVHLTDTPQKVTNRTQLMADRNLKVKDEGFWTVAVGKIRFSIIVQDIVDSSSVN